MATVKLEKYVLRPGTVLATTELIYGTGSLSEVLPQVLHQAMKDLGA
ncbi:MAG: hypothetical protein WBE68_23695 [Candidatus Nitrosopolaris sp.]|jgi:hypothetical protein